MKKKWQSLFFSFLLKLLFIYENSLLLIKLKTKYISLCLLFAIPLIIPVNDIYYSLADYRKKNVQLK